MLYVGKIKLDLNKVWLEFMKNRILKLNWMYLLSYRHNLLKDPSNIPFYLIVHSDFPTSKNTNSEGQKYPMANIVERRNIYCYESRLDV